MTKRNIPDLKIELEETESTVLVAVRGPLEVSNLHQFKERVDPLFEESESRHVLLDFEQVERLSSKAIGLLSGYAKTARRNGKMLVFCQVNARIYNVLNLLGTISLFVMYESREAALTAINRGN